MAVSDPGFSFLWKMVHVFLALFFSLASFVNRNDPDWFIWMPIYFVPALLCLSAAVNPSVTNGRRWCTVTTILFYGCLVYAVYEVFALSNIFIHNGVKNPFAFEEGREFGGLTIITLWTGTVLSTAKARDSSKSSEKSFVTSMPWVLAILAVVPLVFWSLCYVPGLGGSLGHCIGMKSC